MKRTSNLRRMIGTGLGCVVLGATVVAMAAPAGAADTHGTTAGAAATACTSRPSRSSAWPTTASPGPIRPLTPEKVQQLKDAAQACDIKLPRRPTLLTDRAEAVPGRPRHHPPDPAPHHGEGRAAQGRGPGLRRQAPAPPPPAHRRAAQCMAGQGITRPIRPLTPEKVQKIKDAADGVRRQAARAARGRRPPT